jgi:hypothetical protein
MAKCHSNQEQTEVKTSETMIKLQDEQVQTTGSNQCQQ